MAQVKQKDNEPFESLYRRFRKKVTDERIIAHYREHTAFLKPSAWKRLEQKERLKKIKRANARRRSADRDFSDGRN